MEYLVEWLIHVDAEDETDAANIAQLIQLDKESTATVFRVTDTNTGITTRVDTKE